MASAVDQATAFKNDGNKAFAAHDWLKAIDLYTKAIELNGKEPTYFTNRAQVCLTLNFILILNYARVTDLDLNLRHTSSRNPTVML